MLLEEYVQESQTVNQKTYFNMLIQLWQAIKMMRRSKLSMVILFIRDNKRSHTAKLIQLLLKDFWDQREITL